MVVVVTKETCGGDLVSGICLDIGWVVAVEVEIGIVGVNGIEVMGLFI